LVSGRRAVQALLADCRVIAAWTLASQVLNFHQEGKL
jgi:hypothetical protein